MARNNDRDRGTRRAPKETGRRTKKKICIFCKEHATWVDYGPRASDRAAEVPAAVPVPVAGHRGLRPSRNLN